MSVDTEETTHVDEAQDQAEPQANDAPVIDAPVVTPDETKSETPAPEVKDAASAKPKTEAKEEAKFDRAAYDREMAQLRQQNAQLSLEREIARMAKEESDAAALDRRAVDAGELTEREAEQRKATRDEHRRMEWENKRLKQDAAVTQAQAESHAYLIAAGEIAKSVCVEEGLGETETELLRKELLSAKTKYTSPEAMEASALRWANKRHREALRKATQQRENFDKGPGAVAAGNTSDDYLIEKANTGKPLSATERTRLRTLLNI